MTTRTPAKPPNLDLIRCIPPDARVVVQIGCQSSELAKAYKRINPRVRYLAAVAPSFSNTKIDSSPFDRLIFTDLEVIQPAELGLDQWKPDVDCLVFDESLETMLRPLLSLTRLGSWLRLGGQIVACVSNVQHYSIIVGLLRGQWLDTNRGAFDESPLRFFTLEGVKRLFDLAGFQVYNIQPRYWTGNEFAQFMQIAESLLRALAIDPATFATRGQPAQFVIGAIRNGPPPARAVIWSLLGAATGSEVRIKEPSEFLATIPGIRIVAGPNISLEHLDRTHPGEKKVFVQQRIVIPRADHVRLQQALLARNYLVIAEFDDDPEQFPALVADDYFALKSCHAIQTTTPVMADTLRAFNQRVAVFPNQIAMLPRPRVDRSREPRPGSPAVTLLFGALNREADWAPLIAPLNQILRAHAGAIGVRVIHDRAFHDALATPHKQFEPLCTYERYHELLDTADIVLAPLERTRFNTHKSDLKFIEAAAHGAVFLAAPTVYEESVIHGETGLIYHSLEEFKALLDRLIRDRPYRIQLGTNARNYVSTKRLLSQHFRDRLDWYRSLWDQLDVLNAELQSRIPELFVDRPS
jgi:hypothetical protein